MGIADRDYNKNNFKLKFNESKGEIELDNKVDSKTSLNRKSDTHNIGLHKNIDDGIKQYNEASRTRRKIRATEDILKPHKKFSFLPWITALVVILVIANIISKSSADNTNTNSSTAPVATSNTPTPIKVNIRIPLTSILSTFYDSSSANCPLTLIANDKNYYIKLIDTMRGDKTVAKFFIRAKEELTLKIPAGNYKIKYGSGGEWYGEKELFGINSQYGESEVLSFSFDGYSFLGHTISFYDTVAGNLKKSNVTRNYVAQD
ncbi:MAG: hypothetical protein PHX13_02210 [Thiovulaceae bacterium]|nr:hypothetical protein [Sulfurimonadaceae bacterium]